MRLQINQCLPQEIEEPLPPMSLNSGVEIKEELVSANPAFSEKNSVIELVESS